jgi:tetratricopeptide (TPR) repeat protein
LGRELGDEQQVLYSLLDSAWAALCQDEYERAAEAAQQSLVLARSLGNEALVGASLSNLGVAALEQADDVRALELHREALEIFRELGDPVSAAEGLEGIAGAIGEQDEGEKAARLYAAAEALRAFHDAPVLPGDLPRYDRRLSVARAHVDETTWKQAWEEGRVMTMEDAISYALEQAVIG